MEIATYKYKHKEGAYPFTEYVPYSMKVEVVEELKNGSLRIEFKGYHADGRPPGTVTTVKARNVKRNDRTIIVNAASRSGKTADLAETLRRLNIDTELIRKPYKDD